jgi:hypothetical protein
LLEVQGHVETERLRSLEVDYQLVLGRRLDRQVGRPLALENAINVTSSLPVGINRVWPITDQATGGDYAPSWRIGADGLRFAHPPYELLGKSIHAQYRSIAPRLGNEAR